MTEKEVLVAASKLISRHLRHRPADIGIELDPTGRVDVDMLLAALGRHGLPVDRALLDEIVATSDKQRFAYDPTGTRIRANQGPQRGRRPRSPGRSATRRALRHPPGLRPMRRHHVHLSPDRETAVRVGALEIDAAVPAADGHEFGRRANGVWLVDHVPPHRLRET